MSKKQASPKLPDQESFDGHLKRLKSHILLQTSEKNAKEEIKDEYKLVKTQSIPRTSEYDYHINVEEQLNAINTDALHSSKASPDKYELRPSKSTTP